MSFPRKRESRKYFFFKQIKGKKNGISFWIDKNKESKHWIPNQVGDDSGCDFEDYRDCGFSVKLRMTKEDIKREEKSGFPIETFGYDTEDVHSGMTPLCDISHILFLACFYEVTILAKFILFSFERGINYSF